jgi:ATP-binding cassette subfamily C protein CydCD
MTGAADARAEARDVHRRLLAVSPRARLALAGAVGAGLVAAVLLVVQAWVVADVVGAAASAGRAAGGTLVAALLAAVAVRAVLAAATELLGRRAAELALGELRDRVAARALQGRAREVAGARRGDLATAATQGVDALADYHARAVPQLALAAAVPLGVVGVITVREPLVGVLLAVTLPVVVVFMVLVGKRSADHARERQHALAVLGAHFLEVVRGLPTLRAHGRAEAQAATLRAVADRYRDESLGALRVAFLSALVLELLAMLGTAIAAAVTGVLLASGRLDLATGLFVLLLAPEVYAPLRAAGARFHAAEDGAQAARRLLGFLDEPAAYADPADGDARDLAAAPDPAAAPLVLAGAAVHGTDGRPDPLAPTDLRIAPGTSVAVVGPSGAGKSTLLRLLARAQDPDAGAVRCGDADLRGVDRAAWWARLVWLDQRPPLPTGTLGAALRLHHPAATDAELAVALERADATAVVAGLADGLETPVGTGGRPLSLGQQQRLALAGALVAPAPLVLLDEPTAHLDAEAAARVARGIAAAAAGRTLVVATHDAALAAACDVVVDLAAAPAPAAPVAETVAAAAATAQPAVPAAAVAPAGAVAARRPGRTPAWLRRGPVPAIGLGILGSLAGLAVLGTSGWLVTRAAEQPPVLALLAAIVVVRALGLTRALARYFERLASHDVALRRLADLRVAFFARLAPRVGRPGLPGAADLLTRFTSDVDELQHLQLRVVLPGVVAALGGVVATAAAIAIHPAGGLALGAGLVLATYLVPLATHVLARRALPRQGAARAGYAAELAEALELGPQLAVAGRAGERLGRLRRAGGAVARVDRAQARAAAAGAGAGTLVAGATLAAVLVLGARAAADGTLAAVWLGALVLLAVGAFDAAGALPEAALRLVGVRAARARLAAATAGPELTPAPAQPVALPSGPAALAARGIVHRPGGPAGAAVLDGVDLTVAPGARVAIVGPSGTGKSTLAGVLARLVDPDAGTVTLGGTDLRAADPAAVRARIRLAGQDAHLLAGTLAANVRIGRPAATDAEVVAALRSAGLGPWLAALPAGTETLVGEDGVAVSGGQRQRIGLARALVSGAEVVVLDEPTAMLDPATARAVVDDVLRATAGRTLVVITHDPTGLDRFDAVLELRDGRLRPRAGSGGGTTSAPPSVSPRARRRTGAAAASSSRRTRSTAPSRRRRTGG